MSIENIRARLALLSQFQSVIVAGNNSHRVDTASLLKAAISPSVSGEVYAVHRNADGAYPNATYTLVSSQPRYLRGYRVSHVDTFVLEVRQGKESDGTGYSKILTTMSSIMDALEQSPYSFEITDKQEDFEHKENCYRVDLEITITLPATDASAATPALIIYPIEDSASESEVDNAVRQRITSRYGVAILTTGNDQETLRDAVRTQLIGYEQTTAHWEVQLHQGGPAGNEGGLQIWEDIYYDSINVRAA